MEKEKYVYLNVTSRETTTREPSNDDSWDRGDTYTEWYVEGISLSKDDRYWYETVPLDFNAEPGDTVHVVYAVYSTGDSFGHDQNGRIDALAVYKDYKKAEAAKKVLEAAKDWTANVLSESGEKLPVHVPWLGYFESLTYVDIATEVLKS